MDISNFDLAASKVVDSRSYDYVMGVWKWMRWETT